MRPGDVIDGKYQIEVQLGEGGMGRVLAASHLTLGSTVAIKLLKTEALKFPEVPRRFLREARAAGRLRSEHVVKVTDVGQLPTGEPYMVMELLHGLDLSAVIGQGPTPPEAAVEYIVQACEGLAEAHALGMVHRDIKPANLFVTRRPNGAPLVKVLDFGIATAAAGEVDHNLTSTLTVIGSPSYMSPEQLRAARDVDARSDIWSLGVTLYELLSGAQPFVGPTLTALTLKIVGEPHAPLLHVPPQLASIVDRCLAKEREHRFANVAELAAALAPLFPNGRVAAEMVAGSLSQPVAPTLLGLESSAAISSAPARVASSAPWTPPRRAGTVPPTTTDFTAGESAPMRPARRRRAVAILLGSALAGAIVTTGIVLSQRSTSSAAPAAPAAAPSELAPPEVAPAAPTVTPLPPEPAAAPPQLAAPEPEPEPQPEAAPAPEPAATPEPARPVKRPAVKRPPVKRPPVKRPPVKVPGRDPRAPVEPPDYTKQPPKEPAKESAKDPAKDPVKDPPREPSKEPVKKPCAPNDPTCGL